MKPWKIKFLINKKLIKLISSANFEICEYYKRKKNIIKLHLLVCC